VNVTLCVCVTACECDCDCMCVHMHVRDQGRPLKLRPYGALEIKLVFLYFLHLPAHSLHKLKYYV